MFCPKCGAKNKDSAAFCAKCGTKLTPQTPAPQPQVDKDADIPATKPKEKRKSKTPMIIAVCVILLVAIGAFAVLDPLHVMPWSAANKTPNTDTISISAPNATDGKESEVSTSESTQAEPKEEEKKNDNESLTVTEADPKRISPKESIKVSDLALKEDSIKRYVLTGTVTNVSDEVYDVQLTFGATKHVEDRWQEEKTQQIDLYFQTITPNTKAEWTTLNVYNLGKGEFKFTLYPDFTSVEESIDQPTCEVREVTLPDAKVDWRFVGDESIQLETPSISSDGKLTAGFTNKTDLYLENAVSRFIAYTEDGVPAADKNGARPSGVKIVEAKADLIKPGAKGTLEASVGEEYKTWKLMDTKITVAKDKSSFN